MIGCLSVSALSRFDRCAPTRAALSCRFSSRIESSTANPTADETGLPATDEKKEPCDENWSAISRRVTTNPMG